MSTPALPQRFWRSGSNGVRICIFIIIAMFALPVSSVIAQENGDDTERTTLSVDDPAVQHVMDVQNSVTDAVMDEPGVVGIGTGMAPDGNPAIVIFTEDAAAAAALPQNIGGIPVVTHIAGIPVPIAESSDEFGTEAPMAFGKTMNARTSRADRPVPIGISTGNWFECAAGSIGVRVKNGNNYYALSCNHVWSRTNYANPGELILQPGRSDVSCAQTAADSLGSLVDFEPMVHSTSGNNLMDVAMIRTDPLTVSNSTPLDGYGIPSATVVVPAINSTLKKYGKATGLTTASVAAVNTTIYVSYAAGVTRFTGQIVTSSSTAFVDVGDSGSLAVTNDSQNRSVGILYGRSGMYTFCAPMGPILSRFNVVIDDSPVSPLPVELTSFSGHVQNADVVLNWQTETELQNLGFQVQRSADRENWEDLDFIAGSGTINTPQRYNYRDAGVGHSRISTTLHYRLIQIDRDGSKDFSPIVEVSTRPATIDMTIYPHPVRTDATVQLRFDGVQSDGELHVYSITGERMTSLSRRVDGSSGMQALPLSLRSMPPGQYFVVFKNHDVLMRKRMLIVR